MRALRPASGNNRDDATSNLIAWLPFASLFAQRESHTKQLLPLHSLAASLAQPLLQSGNRYCLLGSTFAAAGFGTEKKVLARRTLAGSAFSSSLSASAASGFGHARR